MTMRKLRTVSAALALCIGVLTLCSCNMAADPDKIEITPIEKLNTSAGELNDHAEEWELSQLEPNFRQYVEVGSEKLRIKNAIYPRIKKLADGSYILFYQDGQIGWNIYYSVSTDLVNWSLGLKLFDSVKIDVDGTEDDKCYSTCDAIVLANGDIMAVASFRSNKHFRSDNRFNGLAMRKSSDGGKTWSEEKVIYTGSNWEPSLLQLPSGEIQVYFTHSAPKNQPQIEAGVPTSQIVASSGTAIIRSMDNGETWEPNVTAPPYAAWRVCQQYTETKNGIQVFTDQMPVAVLLNQSNTIAVVTESKFMSGTKEIYYITMGFSDDNWAKELGIDEEGPTDKLKNMFLGSAPYLRQFPSGETALSNGRNGELQVRLGNAEARIFGNPIQPLKGTGYWGSLELIGSHTMVATMANAKKVNNVNKNTVMISQNILNHRIDAPQAKIKVDGHNKDWADVTDAFFVGSESQAQTSVRPARDDDNVYFLVETLDSLITKKDGVEIYLGDWSSDQLDENTLKIKVGPTGLMEAGRFDGSDFAALSEEDAKAIRVKATVKGTMDNDDDEDTGYLVEVAIPRSMLKITDNQLRCNVVLANQEKDGRVIEDAIGSVRWNVPAEWMPLTVG